MIKDLGGSFGKATRLNTSKMKLDDWDSAGHHVLTKEQTMEKQYDNTNRGVLFINDRKESENDPDRTGSLNVGGVEFYLSGWLKTSKQGKQFLSLSVKPKDKRQAKAPARTAAPELDDGSTDIPF